MKSPLTLAQVLWTLTFAGQLTLLVVLLGRDRIKRFPFFTASIVLFALRLLVEVLLGGRMAMLPLRTTFITLADLMALTGLMVLVEIARRAFVGASRSAWTGWIAATLAVGIAVLAVWGPWPPLHALTLNSPLAILAIMQLLAQKADLLMDVLTVQLGLLVVFCGARFQAGWRSHPQRIIIGLSTVAISWLSVQGIWQLVAAKAHPHSQDEYMQIISLGGKLVNANKFVYIIALVWWIVSLWRDEPGAKTPETMAPATEPVLETAPAEVLPAPEPTQPAE